MQLSTLPLAVFLLLLPAILGKSVKDKQAWDDFGNDIEKIRRKSEGYPDKVSGRRVSMWKRTGRKGNVEELGTYFEGDILHPIKSTGKQGIIGDSYRWPNATIPYLISSKFSSSEKLKISQAFSAYHNLTCIRFRPYKSTDRDFVSIERQNTGCWSNLGRIGGKQKLNLQSPGCLYYMGTIVHELMHTVGFFHEHSRPDRDTYITINIQNIITAYMSNFDMVDSIPFGVPYDYGSVMHYGEMAFSKNDLPTITPKQTGVTIGQRVGLSDKDVALIKAMYSCA